MEAYVYIGKGRSKWTDEYIKRVKKLFKLKKEEKPETTKILEITEKQERTDKFYFCNDQGKVIYEEKCEGISKNLVDRQRHLIVDDKLSQFIADNYDLVKIQHTKPKFEI